DPADRHFDYLKSEPARQEQQFYVESKTIDRLLRKNRPGRIAAKSLEAALGVAKRNIGHDAQQPVKHLPHPLPHPRLPLEDLAPGVLAAADDDTRSGVLLKGRQ